MYSKHEHGFDILNMRFQNKKLDNDNVIPITILQLYISNRFYAQPSDAGQYTCIAENKAGKVEANLNLAVRGNSTKHYFIIYHTIHYLW